MRRFLVALLGVATFATVAAPQGASAAGRPSRFWRPPAMLSVVHGVPGLTVDVYADGAKVLDDWTFGNVAGPLSVKPGPHHLVVAAADSTDDSSPVLAADVTLRPGADYTAVASLKGDGSGAQLNLFTNDTGPLRRGQGRLIVRHLAAAPAVDILADGAKLFSNLENPNEAKANVPAKTYRVQVVAAADNSVVALDTPLDVPARNVRIVYAIGSLSGGSFTVAVQDVKPRRWFPFFSGREW